MSRNTPRALVLAAALALALALALPAPAQAPRVPVVEPDWTLLGEGESTVAIRKAWAAALEIVAQDAAASGAALPDAASGKAARAGGTPLISAMITGEKGAWQSILRLENLPAAPNAMRYSAFAAPGPDLILDLARSMQYLARFLQPTAAAARPVLVDSFAPGDILGVDLPNGNLLWPYALAARKDGSLLVACGSTVLEMDGRWRVTGLPAKRLSDEGNPIFAYGLALTPAGTLYVRSSDGSGTWSFAEGSPEYRRVSIESIAGSAFGVMGDGSPFVVSPQAKSLRVYRGRVPRTIALPADSSVIAAAPGPDDTLWLADAAKGCIRVHSAEGELRDLIYPELPIGSMIMKLKVLADGSFLAATNAELIRFDRSGRLAWSWDGRAEGLAIAFSTLTDFALGPDGTLYVNDWSGRRILRLAQAPAALPPSLAAVAAASAAIRADPAKAELYLEQAKAYEAMDAPEAARATLRRYLDERPADALAADRELGLRIALLKEKAAGAERETAEKLLRLGPETARDSYGRAMRALELILSMRPGDPGIKARIAALKKAFDEAERGAAASLPLPEVASVELSALFPSLIQAYRSQPAGWLVVKNVLPEAITKISAELFVQKYMDFPAEGAVVARLEAGGQVRLALSATLNDRALEVEEDLPLQARIALRFTDSRGERRMEITRPIVLYRRSALTWDDTGKLASFVTPNDEAVARLAFSLAEGPELPVLVSTAFKRAMSLCDGLGSMPLAYVPDPQSPLGTALGSLGVVDTVRFPRVTLAYKGGDCDDTTALLCSLIESVGIETALLTTPGHVFMAFDSGIKGESAWLVSGEGFDVIVEGGKAWIPVETTALAKGFAAAWKAAAELVRKYKGTADFEFLPLRGLRAAYPALPLPPSTLPPARIDPEARANLGSRSAGQLAAEFYAPVSARIEAGRARLQGAAWTKETNRLARLAASYGAVDRAVALLGEILKRDRGFVAAYLNLATISLMAGKRDEAMSMVRGAQAAAPGSPQVAAFIQGMGLAGSLAAEPGKPGASRASGSASGSASMEAGAPWIGE